MARIAGRSSPPRLPAIRACLHGHTHDIVCSPIRDVSVRTVTNRTAISRHVALELEVVAELGRYQPLVTTGRSSVDRVIYRKNTLASKLGKSRTTAQRVDSVDSHEHITPDAPARWAQLRNAGR